MRWLLRFLAWATLLVVPCRLASGPYQEALAAPSQAILRALGDPISLQSVEVFAPVDLGLFAAMCLASIAAPARARARGLLIGIPILIALEIAQVVAGIHLDLSARQSIRHQEFASTDLRPFLQLTIWSAPALLWLLLLGDHHIPSAARAGRRRGGRPGEGGDGAGASAARGPGAR